MVLRGVGLQLICTLMSICKLPLQMIKSPNIEPIALTAQDGTLFVKLWCLPLIILCNRHRVAFRFKDARSVSLYTYNRSQILQCVKYTK